MSDHQQVRESVARRYAKIVSTVREEGSCVPTRKGVVPELAGYSNDELSDLPADAVANSLGCGNPLAFSEVKEGEVVLDLGSGAGIDLLLAARKVGPSGKAIGVDMTDEMIAKAREVIKASRLANIEVRKGLIEDLPVEPTSVDWVISNCVIILSPEKKRVFAETARVLRPGGRMLVTDIVADDLPEHVREELRSCNCCVAGAISENEYQDGLARVGLAEFEIRERIRYEVALLRSLIESNFSAAGDRCCGGGGTAPTTSARKLAEACEGKVWSAKIFARKPA